MATNEDQQSFAPVLQALATLSSNDRAQKGQAHEYLEQFQKSASLIHTPPSQLTLTLTQQAEAWTTTFAILHSQDAPVEAKLFAATTLKGKVCERRTRLVSTCTNSPRSSSTSTNYPESRCHNSETPFYRSSQLSAQAQSR